MKKTILLLYAILLVNVCTMGQKKLFIRVYNTAGEKIGKGYLLYSSDTTIELKLGKTPDTFSVSEVGYIKTKRSFGHSILVSSSTSAAAGAVIGYASSVNQDKTDWFYIAPGDAAAGCSIAGGITGAIIGTIADVLTKKQTINIDANQNKWREARSKLILIPK